MNSRRLEWWSRRANLFLPYGRRGDWCGFRHRSAGGFPQLIRSWSGSVASWSARNWICEMECDALDTEIPTLKIGKAAVALFQADIGGAREFLRDVAKKGVLGKLADNPFSIGALEQLTDTQWDRAAQKFFAGSGSLT